MAENSKIEWTHHTFNPWWGCTKVSPACKHCYAQSWAKRVGENKLWGVRSKRRFFTDRHWSQPLKWNKEATLKDQRKRVFCASMADLFEDRPELEEPRDRIWALIDQTPNLDWLLLTKRIELVDSMVPYTKHWPDNVWLGTTVEDQRRANERMPLISQSNAKVKFLSCEPLLANIDLTPWIENIDWVIAGGESGSKARPMNPDWLRDLRDQVTDANKAFHFKQWGDWFPITAGEKQYKTTKTFVSNKRSITMARVGKKNAGRQLDGKTWDGLPALLSAA